MVTAIDSGVHLAALKAALNTVLVPVYVSQSPATTPQRYAVIHPRPGQTSGSVGDPAAFLTMHFQLTCVGTTTEQAVWVHDQVSALVNRLVLVIDGRECWPIWNEGTQPVLPDRDLVNPLFYATSQWCLHTRPSS